MSIWCEEAAKAIGAKRAGVIVDIWKAVGMRRVHCLLRFDSPDVLDNTLSFALPIMQQNGSNVKINVKPLRGFHTLAEHLRKVTAADKSRSKYYLQHTVKL